VLYISEWKKIWKESKKSVHNSRVPTMKRPDFTLRSWALHQGPPVVQPFDSFPPDLWN
jgi:hypothetical protein